MLRYPLAALCALVTSPALACAGFHVHDAYAISATPMSPTGAAFMVIHNHSDTDCHVALVRSDIAARTELHTHVQEANGVMRMVEVVEGWPLPAEGELVLERGGKHVMFMGLNAPLEQDQVIDVTFVFEDGSESVVPVTVDLTRVGGGHGMGHGQSGQGHGHGHGHGHGQGG